MLHSGQAQTLQVIIHELLRNLKNRDTAEIQLQAIRNIFFLFNLLNPKQNCFQTYY